MRRPLNVLQSVRDITIERFESLQPGGTGEEESADMKIQFRTAGLVRDAGTDRGQVAAMPPTEKSVEPIANRIATHQANRFGAQR